MPTNLFSITLKPIILFYADPGAGALLLQLIIASFVGGLFYFRKFKDKILGRSPKKKASVDAQV